MKKYEFTGEIKVLFGRTLHQIRATVAFGNIKEGEVGGWIEKEENLAIDGNAWVYGDAKVCGNAEVWGNAEVYGDAKVCGNAKVYGDAEVWGNSHYLVVGPLGSRGGFTTFFRTKNLEICVTCGCFHGNIKAFAEKVKKTHGDNEHARKYLASIEFAKTCIDLTPES